MKAKGGRTPLRENKRRQDEGRGHAADLRSSDGAEQPAGAAGPGSGQRAPVVVSSAPVRRWLTIVVMAVTAIACLAGIRRPIYVFDEGYILYGSQRVADGFVPYRDFWIIYPPAQFYVVAALFKVLGSSVLIMRLYDSVVRVALVAAAFRFARRAGGEAAGLAAALVALLMVAPSNFYGYPMFPALVLSIFALDLCTRPSAGRRGLLLAGATAGVAALFRHDAGFYCALGAAALAAVSAWKDGAGWGRAARQTISFAAGLVAVIAVPALLLVAVVPLRELWNDLVVFPTLTLNVYRSLPLPSLLRAGSREAFDTRLLAYLPVVLLAGSLAAALWRRGWVDLVAPALAGLAFARQGLSRVDINHMFPATILAGIVVAVAVERAWREGSRILAPAVGAAALVLAMDPWIVLPARLMVGSLTAHNWQRSSLPRARGIHPLRDQEAAAAWIREHTEPGEAVFVGHVRHDRIMANDIAFWFLAERDAPSRWFDLCPGVVTTAPVQQQMIRDLEQRGVRYAVLRSSFGSIVEPNASGRSSGVTLLDEYLRARFRPVVRFGDFTITERKGPPPAG